MTMLCASCSTSKALLVTAVEIPSGPKAVTPSLATDTDGGFVLTWQEKSETSASLHFAKLNPAGQMVASGTVATAEPDRPWFVNWADFPSLVVLDNGDWVTFWLQKSGPSVYAYDIMMTRSADHGQSWAAPLRLNRDGTQTEHGFVTLLPAGDDAVLALWLDGRQTGTESVPGEQDGEQDTHEMHSGMMTLRSAVVDAEGNFSRETQVDDSTCDCCNTDAIRYGEQFMTIYRDRSESEVRDMYYSLSSSDGSWSGPQIVYQDNWQIAACPVNGPALAINLDQVLAVWTTMQGQDLAVRASLGSISGFDQRLDIEFGPGVQGRVDAAAFGELGFLLSWLGRSDQNPADGAVKLVFMNLQGQLQDEQTIAELSHGRSTGFPRMASSGQLAVLAFTEPTADGSVLRVVHISR